MKKKYLYELEAVFDEKEARDEAARKKEREIKNEQEERLQTFFYRRETVYKPLFESVKKIVEENGMKSVIENENKEESSVSPVIKISFIEKAAEENSRDKLAAEFVLAFDKVSNHIIITENKFIGKTFEESDKYVPEGVTEDFLSMRLVKLIKSIVLR